MAMKKIISILVALCILMTSSLAFASPVKKNGNNKWKNYDIKELRNELKKYYKDKGKRNELINLIISHYKSYGKNWQKYWKDYWNDQDDDRDEHDGDYYYDWGDVFGDDFLFVFVKGEEIGLWKSSVIKYNKIILPVKVITKGLGANLEWNGKTHVAMITKGNTKIVIDFEKKTVTVNGKKIETELNKQKNNAVVLIKLIAEILGYKVDMDDDAIIIDDGDVISINDNVTGTGQNQFEYVGNWTYAKESGAYNGDNHWSATTDAYFQVRFSGTQIKLYGSKVPFGGIAAISIDGGPEKKVDLYASSRKDNVLLYSSTTLPNGQHTLKVRVTGKKNKKSTNYYVIADKVEVLGATTPTKDTQAPTVPQGLKAVAVSESRIKLDWSASSDNIGIAGYKVFRNGKQIATVTNGTTYTDTGLKAATPYSYTVVAYDKAGNTSAHSASVVCTTLGSSTTNVALNKFASADSILTGYDASNAVDGKPSTRWSAADGGLNHWLMIDLGGNHSLSGTEVTWPQENKVYKYKVEVSADGSNWVLKVDKTGNTSTSKTQKDAFTADSARFVRITVTGLSMNTWAGIAEFKVFGSPIVNDTEPPAAPTNLKATAIAHDKVKLSWTPSTDNVGVAGYKIYRNGTQLATVSNDASFTDTGLSAETAYVYSVAALDAAGNTSLFATVMVTTPERTASDIALKKTAFADSTLTGYEASKANDGDLSTTWYAEDGNLLHWWKVDLGDFYNLKGSEITWPLKDKVYKYIIEVSSDNSNWMVVVNKTGNTSSARVQKDTFTADSVRYVKVTVTGLEQGCWAGITEFKAIGVPKAE